MNSFKNLIFSLLTGGIASVCAFAATGLDPVRHQQIVDSVKLELSNVHSSADSIPLLFDLFDLAPYWNRFNAADSIYQAAVRAGDIKVQTEMCYRMADIAMTMSDPDLTTSMLDRLDKVPDSPEKEIARCYIKTCIAPSRKFSDEKELAAEIRRLLAEINDSEGNKSISVYDRIARMFNLADYLQGYTQGTYLTEFMDRLEAELARLPKDKAAILRNKFYATAAMMYMRNEQFDKSINADRKLLSEIEHFETENKNTGRKFRDFTIYRFVSYRRMLKGYAALSEEEVQSLYDKIMELAKVNPAVRDDIEVMPLPDMVLNLKKGNYAAAIPYLETLVDNSGSLYEKKYYLRRLKAAADSTGNQEVLKRAAVEYSNILEQYTDLKTAERMRELQINYDYEALRNSNAEELKHRERLVTILAIVASVLFIIVAVAFIVMTTRLSSGKRKLAKVNKQLLTESEELRKATESLTAERNRTAKAITEKTQLVNYVTNEVLNPINSIVEYSQMIVDNAQGENKKYLERFKSIVTMNTRLLQGLVADVQELIVAESGTLPINLAPVDLNALAHNAVDSIMSQVSPGVHVSFIPANGDERLIFNTDSRRVEIILLNLLSNAAKFTPQGSITLALEMDRQTGDAIFSVTDTGIGVPADKSEVIFNRYEKLNPDIEGSGLGLSVCQLVARALNATVRLDTTYPGPGARFLLILHPQS